MAIIDDAVTIDVKSEIKEMLKVGDLIDANYYIRCT